MKIEYFISILVLKLAWNTFKNARLDFFLVHLAGQSMDGLFRAKAIASKIGMKPQRVYKILDGSDFFERSGNTFSKRERLAGLFADGFIEVIDGQAVPVEDVDFDALEGEIKETLIDQFMSVVTKHGDGMTLFDMAIQLAVYEGCTRLDDIIQRVGVDSETTRQAVEQLVEKKLLVEHAKEGEVHYSFTSKSSDIFGMIFRSKRRARRAKS